jgi:mRNA interferase RelE/StbE
MGSYRVEVTQSAHLEIRRLPGNIRQRVLRSLRELEQESQPHTSQPLDLDKAGPVLETEIELRRVRIEYWRIVYAVEIGLITVLAVRKRPPYKYDDLDDLIRSLR